MLKRVLLVAAITVLSSSAFAKTVERTIEVSKLPNIAQVSRDIRNKDCKGARPKITKVSPLVYKARFLCFKYLMRVRYTYKIK